MSRDTVRFETYTDNCRLYETWEIERPEGWDAMTPRSKGDWLIAHCDDARFISEYGADEQDRTFWRVVG